MLVITAALLDVLNTLLREHKREQMTKRIRRASREIQGTQPSLSQSARSIIPGDATFRAFCDVFLST